MFTLRKNSSKRASLSFLQPQNASDIQQNCNSLFISNDLPRDNLIFLMLNSGCFREIMRSNSAAVTQYSTAAICNQICSLLVFSSREFTQNAADESAERIQCPANGLAMDQQITVLLDAPKVPMKALRLVLRACQSALAYKIRQCILLEQDWFIQHRVALDVILHEKYDFKVIVCPHSKLLNFIGLATLFDLQSIWSEKPAAERSRQQRKSLVADTDESGAIGKGRGEMRVGKWVDAKKAFSVFFAANPSYSLSVGSLSANVSTASLLRLMRKDRTILIELVEHDLDSVFSPTSLMPIVQQNKNQMLSQEKFGGFVEEKGQQREEHSKLLANVGCARNARPLVEAKTIAQRQRDSLIYNGLSSSVTDFSSMNSLLPTGRNNKTQKEREFEITCSSSVGLITERNGGIWPAEKSVDELSVARVAASVRLLLDWIGEHGERGLTAVNDCWKKLWTKFSGEIFYLDFIERERIRLTEETEEKLNELANANDEMEQLERKCQANGFSEKPKELKTLGQSLHKVETRIYRLRNALNAYKLRIDNARRFKEIIGEFHKECDALFLILYENDGVGKSRIFKVNGGQIKDRVKSVKERHANLEKNFELASETSSSFRFLLLQCENGELIDFNTEEVLRQISVDSEALTKRRQRFAKLVEFWHRQLHTQTDKVLLKLINSTILNNTDQMARRRKEAGKQSYKLYVRRMLKQTHPGKEISTRVLNIMES
ncbi:hypothetical protein niasHT_009248 [Heterodera trifolii]|uniref:Uncharacterized protein n=1 Tax=Heterodera trifolii TaxID=157864 RepID=A0ABD2LYL2_9BILA